MIVLYLQFRRLSKSLGDLNEDLKVKRPKYLPQADFR
jgi:hypothetical protein